MQQGYRRLFAVAIAVACAAPVWAQGTGTIVGRVVDRQSQRPVVSAQVRVAGTTRGASTDETGAYRIVSVPAGVTQLVAQRIGYGPQSRTVTVGENASVTADFQMAIAATTLDQVVVTATGQSERKRESGAVTASIDSSMLNKAAISTFADALSSRAPGVVVQTAAGETGAGSRIRIRGSNSISLSNEPLIILDGVRMDNTPESTAIDVGGQLPSRLNDINSEEIESIEVIKGPAAAALYGTAASNGVIQITTRKGRAGKARWDTFAELGNLHNVDDYPLNLRSYGKNAAGGLVTNCSLFSRTNGRTSACVAIDSTIGNNPIEAAGVYSDGNRRIAGASAAGGADNLTYFVSGEYQKEQNIIQINNQQRANLRTNLRAQLAKNLDAQINIGYVNSDLRRPQNDNNSFGVSAALLGGAADCRAGARGTGGALDHPGLCLSGTDTVSHGYFNRGISPYDFFNIDVRQRVQRLTGGLTSNWTPLSWLAFNGTFGADINHRADTQELQPDVLPVSANSLEGYRGVYRAIINNFTTSLNATATYDWSPSVKLTTSVGSQYVDAGFTRTDAFGAKLLAGTGSLAGTNARFAVGELSQDVRTLGFLGREQIAWRDRAFLTVAARTDKNSAFGANFQRVIYPSVSASWVLNEEPFFPNIGAISSLRLRAAIGSAGQNPGFLAAEQFYTPVTAIVRGVDVPAFTVGGSGNPNLKPEKSTEVEGGFDLGLFGDRVGLEYTHYNKVTKDALVNVVLAPSLGSGTNRFQNLGQVRNLGDEALLRANLFDGRTVKFDMTVNGSWTSNRLDDLGTDENGVPIPQFTGGFNTTQIFKAGLPLGAYYDRALSYNDANGDGLIACPQGAGSPGCEYSLADDPTYQGTPFPNVELSFSPALSVGRFVRVTATIDHRGGQKLYNLTGYYRNAVFLNGAQVQTPNASNLAQQAAAYAAANEGVFTGFFEDASFTKLREVAISFMMPQTVAARLGAGAATLTLAGRNLHTWTKYSGIDPELNAGAQSNFTAADFLTTPQVRYLTARLALSF